MMDRNGKVLTERVCISGDDFYGQKAADSYGDRCQNGGHFATALLQSFRKLIKDPA
jgi:hypothetical protein